MLSFNREEFEKFAQLVKDGMLPNLSNMNLFGPLTCVHVGKVKPVVDSVYSFDDVLKAYERIMTSRAAGKVVVKVDPSAT